MPHLLLPIPKLAWTFVLLKSHSGHSCLASFTVLSSMVASRHVGLLRTWNISHRNWVYCSFQAVLFRIVGSIPACQMGDGVCFPEAMCLFLGFPGVSDSTEYACNAGDSGSVPNLVHKCKISYYFLHWLHGEVIILLFFLGCILFLILIFESIK